MSKPNPGLFGGNPVPTAPKGKEGPRQGPFEEKPIEHGNSYVPALLVFLAFVAIVTIVVLGK